MPSSVEAGESSVKMPQRRNIEDISSAIDIEAAMQGLQQFLAFAQTARRGSFAAAARDLGGSPSTMAKSVARLETSLGVKLFHRTTRQVSLTADGERLFHRCERVLRRVRGPEGRRLGDSRRAVGHAAPRRAGRSTAAASCCRSWRSCQREHPALVFEVRFQDGFADLVKDGVDLAVRAGELRDSSLVARRIDPAGPGAGREPRLPARRTARRRGPEDLAGHEAVVFRTADQRTQSPLAAAPGPAHRRVASAAQRADQRQRGARRPRCSAWACASCPTTSSTTRWRAASSSRCWASTGRRRCRSAPSCLRAGCCRRGCGCCSMRWRRCATETVERAEVSLSRQAIAASVRLPEKENR